MAMTVEQKRAIALASARLRLQQQQAAAPQAEAVDPARITQAFDVANERPPVNTFADVAKSGASGLARGAAMVAGFPGSLADAASDGLSWAAKKGYMLATGREPQFENGGLERMFADAPQGNPANRGNPLSSGKMLDYLSTATGGASEYQPQTVPGEYARTLGEFAPGAAVFGGINPANMARFAALPAVASETAGQVTKGTDAEPWARGIAAVAAPFAPSIAGKVISPNAGKIDPKLARHISVLEKEGVPLTAGQKLDSKPLQYREAELGGNAASNFMQRQNEAFTAAAFKRIGVNATEASPEVIENAAQTIGKQFDDLTAGVPIKGDKQMVRDILSARGRYLKDTPKMAQTGTLDAAIKEVSSALKNGGTVPAEMYQNLRSEVGRVMRDQAGSNPQTFKALKNFVDAIDDAMERTLATAKPQDLGKWKQTRRAWQNFLIIERASTKLGQNAARGLISPASLSNATINILGRRAFARGRGDMASLARAGEAMLKDLPQSGTKPRFNAALPMGIGGVTGGTLGDQATDNWLGTGAGVALGMLTPRLMGSALMSRPGQAYLANQAAPAIPARLRAQLALGALTADRNSQR